MKMICTANAIISLENVRRVDYHTVTTKHTSKGVPYFITDYTLFISYCNTPSTEHIKCGENEKGKQCADKYFDQIKTILSEKG